MPPSLISSAKPGKSHLVSHSIINASKASLFMPIQARPDNSCFGSSLPTRYKPRPSLGDADASPTITTSGGNEVYSIQQSSLSNVSTSPNREIIHDLIFDIDGNPISFDPNNSHVLPSVDLNMNSNVLVTSHVSDVSSPMFSCVNDVDMNSDRNVHNNNAFYSVPTTSVEVHNNNNNNFSCLSQSESGCVRPDNIGSGSVSLASTGSGSVSLASSGSGSHNNLSIQPIYSSSGSANKICHMIKPVAFGDYSVNVATASSSSTSNEMLLSGGGLLSDQVPSAPPGTESSTFSGKDHLNKRSLFDYSQEYSVGKPSRLTQSLLTGPDSSGSVGYRHPLDSGSQKRKEMTRPILGDSKKRNSVSQVPKFLASNQDNFDQHNEQNNEPIYKVPAQSVNPAPLSIGLAPKPTELAPQCSGLAPKPAKLASQCTGLAPQCPGLAQPVGDQTDKLASPAHKPKLRTKPILMDHSLNDTPNNNQQGTQFPMEEDLETPKVTHKPERQLQSLSEQVDENSFTLLALRSIQDSMERMEQRYNNSESKIFDKLKALEEKWEDWEEDDVNHDYDGDLTQGFQVNSEPVRAVSNNPYNDNNFYGKPQKDLEEDKEDSEEEDSSQTVRYANSLFCLTPMRESFWSGFYAGNCIFFCDRFGFSYQYDIKSDIFDLVGKFFDTSEHWDQPQPPLAAALLSRFVFPEHWKPLFKSPGFFTGSVKICKVRNVGEPQLLFPWQSPLLREVVAAGVTFNKSNMQSTIPLDTLQDNTPVQNIEFPPEVPSFQEPNRVLNQGPFQFTNSTVGKDSKSKKAAKDKAEWLGHLKSILALAPEGSSEFGLLNKIANLELPLEEPDLSHSNWPLLLKRIEETHPNILTCTKKVNPPGHAKSSSSPEETFFSDSGEFHENLQWLTQIASGQLSPSGDIIAAGKPLPSGKNLPFFHGKGKRFYRHGDSKHTDFSLPTALSQFIKANARSAIFDNFALNARAVSFLGESISSLREYISTADIMLKVLKEDDSANNLSPTAKAAVASIQKSVTDTALGVASLQANITCFRRDLVTANIQGDLLRADPKLAGNIRADPMKGPIITEERLSQLETLRNKIRERDVSSSINCLAVNQGSTISKFRSKGRRGIPFRGSSKNASQLTPPISANAEPLGQGQSFRSAYGDRGRLIRRGGRRGRSRGRGGHRGSAHGKL